MKHKLWQMILVASLTLLALSVVVAVATEPIPPDRAIAAQATYTPTTVITVITEGLPPKFSRRPV